jgi:hypothetical protein
MPFHVPYLIFDPGKYAQTTAILPMNGRIAYSSLFVRMLFQDSGSFHQLVKRQYMVKASAYVVRTSIRLS